ncbi:MAG: hypothetical protein P8L72_07885 [Flavobacteriaceae bacterium]|nr:hypothetical protein [Flavobacteriaceae bacterium]MDG2315270.1 hypothetical protein [Flavobacteriaceae bacterium]
MTIAEDIFLGEHQASFSKKKVTGEQTTLNGETFYKISNVDAMRPFFMSIVSNSNHWMFISSKGSLSAGRKNSDNALFPYYTDDKITESSETTGSKSIFIITKLNKRFLWEPFSNKHEGVYKLTRNLYKNSYGNKVIFEEINHDLEVVFTYEWNSTNQFGFVRKSKLSNNSNESITVSLIDGIQNLLPYGVGEAIQNSSSNLVDAYKKSELEEDTGLGIYSLSAIIVDKAEPSEALKANLVWSIGLENSKKLISSLQLDAFRKGHSVEQEVNLKAEKGAYFLNDEITLSANSHKNWMLIANVNQDMNDVVRIKDHILNNPSIEDEIEKNIEDGSKHLVELVGAADGLQLTADRLRNIRHFANTMFNIMRGGIFDDNYQIEKTDFTNYIAKANKKVFRKKLEILNNLPELFTLNDLKDIATQDDDPNFKRLCFEYLPLKFSRRHGDPSRPWNKFSINTRSEVDGSKILDYQGNWRDIFQNWEALAHSYPEFIEGMIHKFLNATTFDGYNPYRVTKDGFDWETIEPDNPWSYIGYWGDHQIIYLLKFLEFIEDYYPEKLANYFTQDLFVYANVPYRIKSYKDILKDPKNTIEFDDENEEKIQYKRGEIGVDGALLRDETVFIYKVNFIEKILATVLAKMSNFIPEGGIWMNTQRPEWNDANNALVGNGVSMVTLYYLRRFLKFFKGVVENSKHSNILISKELHLFFDQVSEALQQNKNLLNGAISDRDRKKVLDLLGEAGSLYRNTIYENRFSGDKETVTKEDITSFLSVSIAFLEHSIDANKRADNLYHAYNLMTLTNDEQVQISYLPEMLEGQVAVLSSGYLSSKESLNVLNSLKASSLFRKDQYSYILYPNKELPRFVNKNTIPKQKLEGLSLLKKLIDDGNTRVLSQDCRGDFHFNGSFNNVESLQEALQSLPEKYKLLVEKETPEIEQLFEDIFDHKSFTGRSGTFFGYEGLGSIYWHMVSKLLLATFEITKKAIDEKEDSALIGQLFDHYFEINAGIGAHKSPEVYGAFPTDPYSHTPGGKGAQQPGMTGQVKEDILSRFGELGVVVENGILQFNPAILRNEEFLQHPEVFEYVGVTKQKKSIELEKDSLAFTYCQVPVVYKKSFEASIEVQLHDGTSLHFKGNQLDKKTSTSIFERDGKIIKLTVFVVKE